MSDFSQRTIETPPGAFRILSWPGNGAPILMLHGLTAVAESWLPTVSRLRDHGPVIAIDQRGHGRSTHDASRVSARAMAADLVGVMDAAGIDTPHLVGHSMGARVAMVAAARHAGRFRSVAIADIGPEAWRQNWVDTVAALDRQREAMAPGEVERIIERRGFEPEMAEAFRARFEPLDDGGARPLGSRETMKRIVKTHRSANYWREWEALALPALLIRGAESDELRPATTDEMRRRNPRVRFVEMAGVGHNIPLLDPAGLARELDAWWESLA